MSVSSTIEQIIAQIRTAVYGRDVRESIAQGIEKCYDDTSKVLNLTASASNVSGNPTVTVSEVNNHKHFSFGIPTNEVDSTNSTSKLYLIGSTSQSTGVSTNANSNVYATNGAFHSTSSTIGEHCTLQWNSTDNCIDFVFS